MDLNITQIDLQQIHLPKRALKEHPARQIEQIAQSIEAFGFNDPIAIDEQNHIIEGVGRVLAAQKLGLKTTPVIRLSHLSDAQKRAYRIAHNKLTLNTGFDLEALQAEFEALCKLDSTLPSLTGFEIAELEDLLAMPELPDLALELTESLKQAKSVTCPNCGESFHA